MRRAVVLMVFLACGCTRARALVDRIRGAHVAAAAAPRPAPSPPPPAPPPSAKPVDAVQRVQVTLHGPLERELTDKVERESAPALALVMQRISLWWMDANDARPGDSITALYELPSGHEPVVHALRYTSQKLGKTLAAYLYQPPGAPFARFYTADGAELEERLVDSPIQNYEQVTSFLKDGRHHKGVDFKTPVGTPVLMPFDGTLLRRDWNWHGNGNCLELVDDHTGRHAKFLHLSVLPASLQPGQHFKKGQQIALSGNTGHTTAPHLHYQLESPDGQILDPFKIHATYRAHLDAEQMPAFKRAAAALDARLDAS